MFGLAPGSVSVIVTFSFFALRSRRRPLELRRAFTMTVWGATRHDDDRHIEEAGWLPEMSRDLEAAEVDPALADGLYHGPSRGHTDQEYAKVVGLPGLKAIRPK